MGAKRRHLTEQPNGHWKARFRLGGRQHQATFRTRDEAELWLARMMQKRAQGEALPTEAPLLRDFAEEWLAGQEARLRPTTHRRYGEHLRLHVLPRLGHVRVAAITPDAVARVVAELERDRKAGWTIRGCLVALGRVLGTAERRGLITSNPVRKLERSERPRVTPRAFPSLDRDAIGRLIAHTPAPYRTLIAVSVLTGLRQGEALALRWEDVDLRAGVLHVRHSLSRDGLLVEPKTVAARREIPLPPSLVGALRKHREVAFAHGHARPRDFVFCTANGAPLDPSNIRKRGLEKAVANANLPRLRWHDLRHIAATVMIAEGASIVTSRMYLGTRRRRSRSASTHTRLRRWSRRTGCATSWNPALATSFKRSSMSAPFALGFFRLPGCGRHPLSGGSCRSGGQDADFGNRPLGTRESNGFAFSAAWQCPDAVRRSWQGMAWSRTREEPVSGSSRHVRLTRTDPPQQVRSR